MANLEVLALDTAVPQIRAPGAGDGYSVPRDMTMASGTTLAAQAVTSTSLGTTGNLTFSGTAQRITGDMSNATDSNRLAFQTSTTNGSTRVNILTNGTGTASSLDVFGVSDPTNAAVMRIRQSGTESQVLASITGTGTYLPMTFFTGGAERMRLDTSGQLGIGTANPQGRLHVTGTTTNLTSGYSALNVFSSDALAADKGGRISLGGVSGNGASFDPYGFVAIAGLKENATASNFAGYFTVSTSNAGGVVTERMRIDSSGNVGIGGTADANAKVMITGTYPVSSNSGRAMRIAGTIPSGTTDNFIGVASIQSTQAASFTLSNLFHFYAIQSTIGAGSAITNQYGFFAQSSLTGATNNYGFYSDIASGSNRWNFYAAGTAVNYFAGNTGIGVDPGAANIRLYVKGANQTAGQYTITAQDGSGNNLFFVENNGLILTGTQAGSPYNNTTGNAANMYVENNGVLYRSTSSLRYKTDVTNAAHGLADVLKLRSVTYKGKNDGDKVFGGLIAEEVHDAGLTEFVAYDKEGRPDALHYGNMVALLVKAIQELSAKVAALEAK